MAGLTPRQRRHAVTRQAILEAAREIISEQGPAGLSMRGLAQQIDYSPSGLYEYFSGKDEILKQLREEGFYRLGRYLGQVPADLPPTRRLVEKGMAYLEFAHQYPEQYLLMFGTNPNSDFSMDQIKNSAVFSRLIDTIQAGLEQGEFKIGEYDKEIIAFSSWTLVHGIAMLRLNIQEEHREEFDRAGRLMVELHVAGLTAI
jgi:AcrR family transcriptional regulator